MKKSIIGIAIILVIIASALIVFAKPQSQLNLYTDVQKVTNVNQGTESDYFVYFSMESCVHGEQVRSDVERFIEELKINAPEVGFYLVDMEEEANTEFWASGDIPNVDYYIDPAAIPENYNIEDFKIAETPTLIYVSDGVITDIAAGSMGVASETEAMGVSNMLEKKAIDLGFEFNAIYNDPV